MKTLLSSLLCAACLGTMSLSVRADISPEPHKMPLPKPLAQAIRKGGDDVSVHMSGLFAVKGKPVAIWRLEDRLPSSVYLCPGKADGTWGKAQLALKELPSYTMGEVGGPAVVHDPANSGTLLFYFTSTGTEDGEGGNHKYFVAKGRGVKVSPRAHEVKFARGKVVEDGLFPYSPCMQGIVLKNGKHKGRIVLIMGFGDRERDSVRPFYSDDHGRTWKVGKNIDMAYKYADEPGEPLDERRIPNKWSGEGGRDITGHGYPLFEADNGHIRAYVDIQTGAWLQSEDGGETWKAHVLSHEEMRERRRRNPGKNRLPEKGWTSSDNLILNAGDARGNNSRLLNFGHRRGGGVCVSLSYDWGVTWPYSKQFAPAPYEGVDFASGCAVLSPGVIGVALSSGREAESIESLYAYTTVTLSWLTDGADDGTGALPGAEPEAQESSPEQP